MYVSEFIKSSTFKQRKEKQKRQWNLVESKARRNKGGTMLSSKALSRNFHTIGTLLSQQMYETNMSATSMDGSDTPSEFKYVDNCIAQRRGSIPFSWASLVSSITLSHMLLCEDSAIFKTWFIVIQKNASFLFCSFFFHFCWVVMWNLQYNRSKKKLSN